MRFAAIFCSFFLTCGVWAAEPNPFAPDGVAVEPTAPPSGPPRSKAEIDRAVEFLDDQPFSSEAPRVTLDAYVAATVRGDAKAADDMWVRLALHHPESVQHRFLLAVRKIEDYRKVLVEAGNSREFDRDFADRFLRAARTGLQFGQADLLSDDELLVQLCLAAGEFDRVDPFADTDFSIPGGRPLPAAPKLEEPPAQASAEWSQSFDGNALGEKPVEKVPEKTDRPEAKTEQIAAQRAWIVARCRAKLREGKQDREGARVGAIVLDDVPAVEKVLRLHPVENARIARRCEEHYYARLSEVEQASPAVAAARVELLLEKKEFAEALPVVERLLGEGETAQRLFWKGWCQATLGDPAADETLGKAARSFPGDPWAEPALRAAEAVAAYDRNLDEQAAIGAAVVRRLAGQKLDLIEANAEWAPKNGAALAAYGFADLGSGGFEASIRRGERWVAAVRAEGGRTRLIVDGEPSVHDFKGAFPFTFPRPVFFYDPAEGNFRFAIGQDAAKIEDGEFLTDTTLAMAKNLQPAAARPILDGYRLQGMLPAGTERVEERVTCRWLAFSARRPDVAVWSVSVNGDDRIVAASGPKFAIRGLRYGPTGSFDRRGPAWPDLPVVAHEQFEPSVLFQVLATVTKLWADEGPSDEASASAGAPERK